MTLPKHRLAAAALVTLVASVLAACGTTDTANVSAGTRVVDSAGTRADTATITAIDGTTVQVPAGRPTAVFFFSVNCGSCVDGVKSLGQAARLAEQAGTRADFLIADLDPSESPQTIAEFQRFTDSAHIPAVIDTGAVLARQFKVAALSTLIVVDATGKVAYRGIDPSAERIIAALDEAATPA